MKSGIGSHTRPNDGQTHEWLTPPDILALLGPFDLDPCAAVKQPWQTAYKHYTIRDNGLMQPWAGRVFCNPPYGSNTGKWLQRCAEHGNAVALTFARTETKMFFRWVWPYSTALLFLEGRPHFYHPDGTRANGNSGGPVVLVAYGLENGVRLRSSGIAGAFVVVQR